jgi:hypothetical protein
MAKAQGPQKLEYLEKLEYHINLFTIATKHLSNIALPLQDGLKTVGSAGPLSIDRLAVLQKNLNNAKDEASLLITTADFDGQYIFADWLSNVSYLDLLLLLLLINGLSRKKIQLV